jgi:hypothetical protein
MSLREQVLAAAKVKYTDVAVSSIPGVETLRVKTLSVPDSEKLGKPDSEKIEDVNKWWAKVFCTVIVDKDGNPEFKEEDIDAFATGNNALFNELVTKVGSACGFGVIDPKSSTNQK